MHIAITSIVRNGMGYLDRYMGQVGSLVSGLEQEGHTAAVFVAEGDSTDGSNVWLDAYAQRAPFALTVYHLPHGGPVFGSVNNRTRWGNIARTWNALYDQIATHVRGDDAVIYIEADLLWKPETMRRLIDHVRDGLLAVSPMCYHVSGYFYDTWGHRAVDGTHFSNTPPYHSILVNVPVGELLPIGSAGSCMVMRGIVALRCRFSAETAMLGPDIYAKGYELWLDPSLAVVHP